MRYKLPFFPMKEGPCLGLAISVVGLLMIFRGQEVSEHLASSFFGLEMGGVCSVRGADPGSRGPSHPGSRGV